MVLKIAAYVLLMGLTTPSTAYTYHLASPFDVTFEERVIIDEALTCKNQRGRQTDPLLLLEILRMEVRAGIPESIRGMSLAAACSESGYNPNAEGDHKFSKKRRALAIGLFQQWPWVEKHYGIDRRNPYQATEAWLFHIVRQVPKTKKKCRWKGERLWVTAWVRAVRAPDPGGRCYQRPKHYRRLKRWRKRWSKKLRGLYLSGAIALAQDKDDVVSSLQ